MPRSARSMEQKGPGSCRERSSMRNRDMATDMNPVRVAKVGPSGPAGPRPAPASPRHNRVDRHVRRWIMNETIRLADYFYLYSPQRPGEAAHVLGTLRDAGVNLVALSGFPQGRRAQVDLVPEDP